MIEIREIGELDKKDINIPNESFPLFGRMIPSYTNEKWNYQVEYFDESKITQMSFPDENYNYEKMKKDYVFLGAYYKGQCVGLAILKDDWFKYMYLYDLKVFSTYRHSGIGRKLIEKAKEIAKQRGYIGLYTLGQDNNLAACLFYIKVGFRIGGFDSNVYKGTKQEGKADIKFYLDC